MFRNQYDNDVTTWSPQGRLHQVEYAMEAVKQGSASVGLKSADYAILLALKRSSSELSAHQKKVIKIDGHCGIAIAGLTADARILSRFMRNECLNEQYAHERPLPITQLVYTLGNKMQTGTQRYDKRPYGVGLLIAGYDKEKQKPHIYQTCPSANYFDCKAMAIGARSQSARTYLERKRDEFKACTLKELVRHGLLALRECLPNDTELSLKNVSLAIVGKGRDFKMYDNEEVKEWLDLVSEAERKGKGTQNAQPEPGPPDEDMSGRKTPPAPVPAEPVVEQMHTD